MSTQQVAIQEFTMTEVFQNFSQIKQNVQCFTETVNQGNVPWNICYVKMAGQFAVYVHCVKPQCDLDWSIKTRIRISMTSIHGKSSFKEFNATFENKSEFRGQGLYDFVSMDEIRHNLLISDQIILEARVEVLEMNGIEMPPFLKYFDENEAKEMSDVTLLVEDQKFYVSKFTLAQQSSYFKTLFFGGFKESKESEIALKDMDSDAFQVYLEVLHMEPALTDSSIEDVLELSQMYDSKNVTRVCEEFLLHKSKLSTKAKLQLGCLFDLKELKRNCLESLRTLADVRACMDCGGLENGVKDLEMMNSLVNIFQDIEKKIIAMYHAHFVPRY
ncbi:hypothetical protein CAEBREN_18644 [Caenorhabditis brenneri]|uniref:BTB domain-containing protein n=1 Tax=Caenorhabditis brenneri TaxID=135651 RepID=G0MD28_CAEBE|nr:hypothetical protein CAEBREN_18644 [Caenorhabditis brenneri]